MVDRNYMLASTQQSRPLLKPMLACPTLHGNYRLTAEAGLLQVNPTEDPLACLDDPDFLEAQLGAGGALMGAPGGPGGQAGGGLLGGAPELVMTADARQTLAMLAPWLRNQDPFLLVSVDGPHPHTQGTKLHCFRVLL